MPLREACIVMWRLALNFVTAILLLLCVATAAMWVRSHYAKDVYQHFRLYQASDSFRFVADMIRSDDGVLAITRWEDVGPQSAIPAEAFADMQKRAGWSVNRPPTIYIDVAPNAIGFDYQRFEWNAAVLLPTGPAPVTGDGALALPYWCIFSLLAVLPLWRLVAWRIRRQIRASRIRRNCCPNCGYELLPTYDRCPRCDVPCPFGGAENT